MRPIFSIEYWLHEKENPGKLAQIMRMLLGVNDTELHLTKRCSDTGGFRSDSTSFIVNITEYFQHMSNKYTKLSLIYHDYAVSDIRAVHRWSLLNIRVVDG